MGESEAECTERGVRFVKWLMSRCGQALPCEKGVRSQAGASCLTCVVVCCQQHVPWLHEHARAHYGRDASPACHRRQEPVQAAGRKPCQGLRRPEQRIAVVSHAGFIRHTLSVFAGGLPAAAAGALEREFSNCELRTVVSAPPRLALRCKRAAVSGLPCSTGAAPARSQVGTSWGALG